MHPIRRRIAMIVFAAGAVAGFGSEFHHAHCNRRERQEAFEQHVARVCVDAARNPRSVRQEYDPGGW